MCRNLDGLYFRVKRDGKYKPVCFSDMTTAEIEETCANRSAEWWKSVAMHLKERLNVIGDTFDIICGDDDDD